MTAEGSRQRRLVQILEHRAGPRIGGQSLRFLACVFDSEEKGLSRGPSDLFERIEQGYLLVGGRIAGTGHPIEWDGAAFVEIGRYQVDHLVQSGRQRRFLGRHGRPPPVGSLEEARVDHHLLSRRPARRTENHPQFLAAGQSLGHPGNSARHTLVAGDHGFDDPFLRREDLA